MATVVLVVKLCSVRLNFSYPNGNDFAEYVMVHGYAHVVNNLYLGWELYAIGGCMNPSIKSQSNLFVAPTKNKEITREINKENGKGYNFRSVGDVLENVASFNDTGSGYVKPNYTSEHIFAVEDARVVRPLTRSAGALRCRPGS